MSEDRKQETQDFVHRLNSGAVLVVNTEDWKTKEMWIKFHLLLLGMKIEQLQVIQNPYIEQGTLLAFNLKPLKYPLDFKFEWKPKPDPPSKAFGVMWNIGA